MDIQQTTDEELLRDVLQTPDDGKLAYQLKKRFVAGFPVVNLRQLLVSDNEPVVKTGSWILSELGDGARPLIHDASRLLNYQVPIVRYYAIETILVCGRADDAEIASRILPLLEDAHKAVRKRSMFFLAQQSRHVLQAMLSWLQTPFETSPYEEGLQFLLSDAGSDAEAVISWLNDPRALARRFAAAAAARIRQHCKEPLAFAATLPDDDISEFARNMIKMKPTRART
jgi:hypothetical protein